MKIQLKVTLCGCDYFEVARLVTDWNVKKDKVEK